jgi:hypothetical protein
MGYKGLMASCVRAPRCRDCERHDGFGKRSRCFLRQSEIFASRRSSTGDPIVAMKSLVSRLQQKFITCGAPSVSEAWPNIAARFRASGDGVGLSNVLRAHVEPVHSDAEETIRYLLARLSGDRALIEPSKRSGSAG